MEVYYETKSINVDLVLYKHKCMQPEQITLCIIMFSTLIVHITYEASTTIPFLTAGHIFLHALATDHVLIEHAWVATLCVCVLE